MNRAVCRVLNSERIIMVLVSVIPNKLIDFYEVKSFNLKLIDT